MTPFVCARTHKQTQSHTLRDHASCEINKTFRTHTPSHAHIDSHRASIEIKEIYSTTCTHIYTMSSRLVQLMGLKKLFGDFVNSHAHRKHAYTCMQAYTQTDGNTRTASYQHTLARPHTYTCMHVCTKTSSYARAHTHMHTHTHMPTKKQPSLQAQ